VPDGTVRGIALSPRREQNTAPLDRRQKHVAGHLAVTSLNTTVVMTTATLMMTWRIVFA